MNLLGYRLPGVRRIAVLRANGNGPHDADDHGSRLRSLDAALEAQGGALQIDVRPGLGAHYTATLPG